MRRAAFSLLEVIVSLSIVLILAAVALPSIAGYAQQARVEAAIEQLELVRDAITETNGFNDEINANPGRLSELSQIIIDDNASYATGTDDSCGDEFSNNDVDDWEDAGPFVNFHIDRTTGMQTPIGRAVDSLTRIPFDNDPGFLRINFVSSVELGDATLMDEIVDGGNGQNTGTIRWVLPATDGVVTMYYYIPINGDC
jgi:prepilin-type N-terminal cleavage/methylation domain-containing protein